MGRDEGANLVQACKPPEVKYLEVSIESVLLDQRLAVPTHAEQPSCSNHMPLLMTRVHGHVAVPQGGSVQMGVSCLGRCRCAAGQSHPQGRKAVNRIDRHRHCMEPLTCTLAHTSCNPTRRSP